jgi:hypothetical protein
MKSPNEQPSLSGVASSLRQIDKFSQLKSSRRRDPDRLRLLFCENASNALLGPIPLSSIVLPHRIEFLP